MTRTKSTSKVAVMVMCVAMLLSVLAISASAAQAGAATASAYSVTIYKENGTDLSMANDIVAGNATVTIAGDGTATVEIPIKPIIGYSPVFFMPAADGYLRSLSVSRATSATLDPASGFYTSSTITIVVPSFPADGRFAVTTSAIELYYTGTESPYFLMEHITPAFVIALS